MRDSLKGFMSFISVERGIMLFMINMGATFLIAQSSTLPNAIYLGIIAFLLWSGVDAINNVYDAELDEKSDPNRAKFTKNLGKLGLTITLGLFAITMSLGAATGILLVVVFIFIGIIAGVIYSVPPFRLRQTILKPIVNLSVGAIPVLIVAAFYNVFSIQVLTLILLMGISTAVNSLWEDLADYKSDFNAKAKTTLVVLGFKKGLYLTIIMGYSLIPLMLIVGMMFQLNTIYFIILGGLITYISVRLIQNRNIITGKPEHETLLAAGESFAKDFVIVALVHTTNLMLSGYLTYQQILVA
ncbi:MAG: UbiA family prenyltransferase [Candidatus Bathyarchaeota archaeon]|nr:UbiA family prenyltransferase [Candidatus Bathyarchaeum sp.]